MTTSQANARANFGKQVNSFIINLMFPNDLRHSDVVLLQQTNTLGEEDQWLAKSRLQST